jgi:hypothetical protein
MGMLKKWFMKKERACCDISIEEVTTPEENCCETENENENREATKQREK